ncbi:MAG: hypothetical protein HY234_11370 [Acidobacteria bacterium]|nr:hypothetical protein [Acidobacteriota bacterium]MBI3663632.1 hypothetical protein [Acidobacteriota bacterium]
MRYPWRFLAVMLCVLALCLPAGAQMGMGMSGPSVRGVWKPVVGSGAAYQLESKREGKREMEFAIVGGETSEGKQGHWLEMTMTGRAEDQVVVKTLMAMDGKEIRVTRMVFQHGNDEPMEMSMQMMGMTGQQQKPQKADVRDDAERVGMETITTPAGTFQCEHWRSKDKSADFWVTDKVGPYGLVKMTSKEENMILIRVITNAKSKIRGTPKKFDPSEMMRRPEL